MINTDHGSSLASGSGVSTKPRYFEAKVTSLAIEDKLQLFSVIQS
jgi:hypothetical protein